MSKVESRLGSSKDRAIEEASAWLALLHGPRQKYDIAEGLRRWMNEDPAHKEAFESVTRAWELTGALSARRLPLTRRSRRAAFHRGMRWGLASAVVAVVVITAGIFWLLPKSVVTTDVGEQRILTLQDVSRVYMNTDTRVRVLFTDSQRIVELEKGEALFEVAPDPGRPFIVRSGGQEVRALGTSFVIRRDGSSTTVTLLDGKVSVATTSQRSLSDAKDFTDGEAASVVSQPVILAPGDRLTINPKKKRPDLDRPQIDTVTAWRQGRVELRDMPLSEAVSEMNRYSNVKLDIESPDANRILVTGAFRAGDSVSFAESVAANCALSVVRQGNSIKLEGEPAEICKL